MATLSSLVVKFDLSPVNGMSTMIISWVGLSRPGIAPVWGPWSSMGRPRASRVPVLISAAAARTTSSVMRLSVPISSSSPQRPQLRTRAASSLTSAGSAMSRSPLDGSDGDGLHVRWARCSAEWSGSGDGEHPTGELAVVEVVHRLLPVLHRVPGAHELVELDLPPAVRVDDERDVPMGTVGSRPGADEGAFDVGEVRDPGGDGRGWCRHANGDGGATPVEHLQGRVQDR